ncbi:MAG: nif-specific transcriptional activator NifA [Candidatus Omnitrophica bacterium]|nr:nif-specific transcriptional activator NifA [Candidatus Omnitrophota bacterium]
MVERKSSDPSIQGLKSEIQELTALYEISRAMNSTLDLEKKLETALEVLHKKLGMERGTLTLFRAQTQDVVIRLSHGLSEEEIRRGRYKLGEGITGKVVATGEPIAVRNVNDEPLFLNRTGSRDLKRQNISFICVPIKLESRAIGALSVDRLFSDARPLEDDVRVLTIVASTIAEAARVAQSIDAQKSKLQDENIRLRSELKKIYKPENIVGDSKAMANVYSSIHLVAPTKATVMLRGESGTGKELVAHAIHYGSPRAEKPFIKVNCASLPEALLESELFGHEKGSFTGATSRRIGRFEMAHQGTLFLDEIGDLSPSTQVKLLRVLQEREFERVGGTETVRVDVRLITATNKDLEKEVREKRFREDLYFRLNVIPIFLPALRERREDIPLLVEYFLKRSCTEHHKGINGLKREAWDYVMSYPWPGNVRELEHTIERAVVLCDSQALDQKHFPLYLQRKISSFELSSKPEVFPNGEQSEQVGNLLETVTKLEKDMIEKTLKQTAGNKRKAAGLLGITERILSYKMKRFTQKPPDKSNAT